VVKEDKGNGYLVTKALDTGCGCCPLTKPFLLPVGARASPLALLPLQLRGPGAQALWVQMLYGLPHLAVVHSNHPNHLLYSVFICVGWLSSPG
jgi:hypothetical protein